MCARGSPSVAAKPSAAATEGARMTKRRKQWLVVALGALAVVAGLLVWRMWFPGRAFEPAAWRDESRVERSVRLRMADGLIARRTLLGKTRAEVVELLGEPPPTDYFADWDMVYWLGPERSFISIDSEWLVVRLAEDGRVVDNQIVRD
jgi:hypothetical protein